MDCLESVYARDGTVNAEMTSCDAGPRVNHSHHVSIVRGITMVTYVVLAQFTDQGIRTVKDSPTRATQVAEMAKGFGCEMKQIYWTLGEYDIVTVIEAADDQSLTTFGLALGSMGNIRTQTLRAFSKDEIGAIIARLP